MPHYSTTHRLGLYNSLQYYRLFRWGIIGTNTAVFILWKYADDTIPFDLRQLLPSSLLRRINRHIPLTKQTLLAALNRNFILHPSDLSRGKYWTLLTSAFSHQWVQHFFFNMWSFDSEIRALWLLCYPNSLTHMSMIYVGGALAGSLAFICDAQYGLGRQFDGFLNSIGARLRRILGQNQRQQPTSNRHAGAYQQSSGNVLVSQAAQGASAAISALFAAQTFLTPWKPMRIFPIPVAMPSWLALTYYVGVDMFGMDVMGTETSSRKIGHWSHLAGTAFGALYAMAVLWRKELPLARILGLIKRS